MDFLPNYPDKMSKGWVRNENEYKPQLGTI